MNRDKSLEIINPEIEALTIQSEIIGTSEDNFERDKEIIFNMYKEQFDDKKDIPLFSEIEKKVLEYNYDKCYEISVIEFDASHRQEVEKVFYSSHNCGMTLNERVGIAIKQMADNMMNDIGWSYAEAITSCIRDSLNKSGAIYEDDDSSNYLTRNIFADFNTFRVVANNAQIVMFQDIHMEEYMYDSDLMNDSFDDVTIYTLERRPNNMPKNKLIGSGGEK